MPFCSLDGDILTIFDARIEMPIEKICFPIDFREEAVYHLAAPVSAMTGGLN